MYPNYDTMVAILRAYMQYHAAYGSTVIDAQDFLTWYAGQKIRALDDACRSAEKDFGQSAASLGDIYTRF